MEKENVSFANKLNDWENANWQLIFKTKEGLDYCRETASVSAYPGKDEIEAHAAFMLTVNNNVATVVIELW